MWYTFLINEAGCLKGHDLNHKVLIIKLGYSETLTPEITEEVSLGDVLRSTALLHLYRYDRVTWLTDSTAVPILFGIPNVEVLPYNLTNILRVREEEFDIVINLEKVPGICALADQVKAWQRYGFRFDAKTGRTEAYLQSAEALYIASNVERKKANSKHWLELLYEMVGAKWNGELYVLGSYASGQDKYDVGLNYRAGRKFQNKAWSNHYWSELEDILTLKYHQRACFQPQESGLYDYMEWVSSCNTLISNDSLGLHLAIAMNKNVVGLFGPTPCREMPPYKKGSWIQRDVIDNIVTEDVERCLLSRGLLQEESK